MTLPRDVVPGRYYMITRRCTQRQFLMRPEKAVNNAFAYCLALSATRFEVDVILSLAMSNHHHTVILDRHGNYPEFIEHFHKLVARCLNAYRGRWENFWSSEQCCVVRLVKLADILDKLVYVATNPVKDDLVEDVHQWPGFSGYDAFVSQKPIVATRPSFFFKAHGKMP